MNKILMISPMEYGSLIDQVKWCEYLKDKYKIIHLSQSNSKTNYLKEGNLDIIKLEKPKSGLLRKKIHLIIESKKMIKENNPDIIIMDYFPGCSFIKLMNMKKKMIVDIRTATITKDKIKKKIRDLLITIEVKIFNETTVISSKVAKKLNIRKYKEIPLGATTVVDEKSLIKKEKEKLKILYVGTFNEREIDKTIFAIKRLINKNPKMKILYTIIGFSNSQEYDDYLKSIINENNLEEYINIVGKVPHNQLKKYYEENNIGLSFIPINNNFDLQPPTKTYEYIMNGLFCLATNTTANRDIINKYNGMLMKDDINSIAESIEKIYARRKNIDYIEVQESLSDTSWEYIVNTKLIPFIEEIIFSN